MEYGDNALIYQFRTIRNKPSLRIKLSQNIFAYDFHNIRSPLVLRMGVFQSLCTRFSQCHRHLTLKIDVSKDRGIQNIVTTQISRMPARSWSLFRIDGWRRDGWLQRSAYDNKSSISAMVSVETIEPSVAFTVASINACFLRCISKTFSSIVSCAMSLMA